MSTNQRCPKCQSPHISIRAHNLLQFKQKVARSGGGRGRDGAIACGTYRAARDAMSARRAMSVSRGARCPPGALAAFLSRPPGHWPLFIARLRDPTFRRSMRPGGRSPPSHVPQAEATRSLFPTPVARRCRCAGSSCRAVPFR